MLSSKLAIINKNSIVSRFKDPKIIDLFMTLYSLKTKTERVDFFEQKQPHKNQTNAQRMYAAIYDYASRHEKENGGFDPFNNDIDLYFPPKLAQEFRQILEHQKLKKEQELQQTKPPFLYHISKTSPEDIVNDEFKPRLQQEQFKDRGMVCAVFAQPNPRVSFHIRSNTKQSFIELPYYNKEGTIVGKRAIIVIESKEKFQKYNQQHPYSYEYVVPSDTFVPNVGYDGKYYGEWLSFSPVAYISCKKIDLKAALKSCKSQFEKVDLCFVQNSADFTDVVKRLKDQKTSLEKLLEIGKVIGYKPTINHFLNRIISRRKSEKNI